MEMKDFLEGMLDRDNTKFKISDYIPEERVSKKDDVDLVLEGLDEISMVKNTDKESEEIEIVLEDEVEIYQEQLPKIKKDLFEGYLGELNEAPNPLEYGANATYRNLREGIVYKKGPDNLWEVFVKDGTPGRPGQSAPGGGCGVTEVKNIVENRLTTQPIVATYPGSPSAPFASIAAALPSTPVGSTAYVTNPDVPIGRTLYENIAGVLVPAAGQPLISKANPGAILNPGAVTAVIFPLGNILAGEIGDGIGEYVLQTGYEQAAANTGSDNFSVRFGGVELFATGNSAGGSNVLWGHMMQFVRVGTTIRVFAYSRLGTAVLTTGAFSVDFSTSKELSIAITPGNGANNIWLRSCSLIRVA